MRLNVKQWLGLVGLLFAPVLSAQVEVSGTPEEVRQFIEPQPLVIEIQGFAETLAAADVARITLLVVTEEKTLTEALSRNAAIRQQLVQTLIDYGIDAEDIDNTQFSSSPQYGLFGRKPSQYEVANRVKVSVASEAGLIFVSETADAQENISLAGITFEHSQREAAQQQVRIDALQDAKAQAAAYAATVGLTLRPIWFNPGTSHHRRRANDYAVMEEVVVTASRGGGAAPAAARPVAFEEVRYVGHATVRFAVVE